MGCAQTEYCGPHLHNSSDGTIGNDMLLLFGAEFPRTIGQEITACFCGAFSVSGLFTLRVAGAGISFLLGGIVHDLATNKFVEAGTVLGHGIASLVCWMAEVAVAGALGSRHVALGCRHVSCCSIGGLLRLGINGLSPPWGFCVEEVGISWIFVLDSLYIVNDIGVIWQ